MFNGSKFPVQTFALKTRKEFRFDLKGLSAEYDFKKIVKVAKKEFACNGTVVEHPEYGEVK